MKAKELREVATCALCGGKFGETGLPMFWRVTIERFGVNMEALQRQSGLEMMLGSPSLAAAMGPDEDLTANLMEPVSLTVCEDCCTRGTCVAALAELKVST